MYAQSGKIFENNFSEKINNYSPPPGSTKMMLKNIHP